MGNCFHTHQAGVVQVISDLKKAKDLSMTNTQLPHHSLPLLGSLDRAKQDSHPLPIPVATHHTNTKSKPIGILPTPRMNILTEISPAKNLKAFVYSELQIATRNFCSNALLGEGGFGCVFMGWLDEESLTATTPESGMPVAVKKLNSQGWQGHKEWLSEINYLGQLHHPNLVKLIGYCVEGEYRLLVYEYMPKGSLENHLFKCQQKTIPLPWDTRLEIAIGAARGLCFLHNSKPKVIYRDFKPSNILLDKVRFLHPSL
ncbi:hypothetical protein LIER_28347 [Lithospermum erythrorhizon]|uniref:non-specific serine/threonine protein kinase n=1 Tax=Lithospermum erythrorhizon TaxID=34254 RepID=A0AAV3RIZ2_LITER